jgi:hypothetical protein
MTKLELCQEAQREAIGGTVMTTTIGVTDPVQSMLIRWIDKAYSRIQSKRQRFRFLREDFSFETIVGTAEYAPTAVSLDELKDWKKDSLRVYLDTVADEQWLDCYPWGQFRDDRLMASNSTVTGRPIDFAIRPNRTIYLWPIPDDEYTIVGEYWKRPQVMSANDSEPLFPAEYHMAIVYRALMFYAADAEAMIQYREFREEFKSLMFGLENNQLNFDTNGPIR